MTQDESNAARTMREAWEARMSACAPLTPVQDTVIIEVPYVPKPKPASLGDACWKHKRPLVSGLYGIYCPEKPGGRWCQSWRRKPPAKFEARV